MNDTGGYTLQMDDETSLNCSLSGKDLSCDPFDNVDVDEEMDMTINQKMTLLGTFSSETLFDGNLKIDMTCEGEGCSFLEMFGMTMPCAMELSFSALHDDGVPTTNP